MPHADPAWSTHSNLLNWNLTYKGAIWSACHAVSVLENAYNPGNPAQRLNFLMQDPVLPGGQAALPHGGHAAGTIPPAYTHQNGAQPVMQFMGVIDAATQNGSEQIYLPKVGWRASTIIGVFEADNPQVPSLSPGPAAKIAFGPGKGDPARGKVMYEGGHSHAKATLPENIAAQRAFLNFSLWAALDKAPSVTVSGIVPSMNGGQAYPFRHR